MIVKDLCSEPDDRLWNNVIIKIKNGTDELKNNYVNLTPNDFECLPVLIKNDEIITFSGLQIRSDRWAPNIGRVNSRMWIAPEHRHANLIKCEYNPDKYYNTRYLLKMQIERAIEIGLKSVFISREGNYKTTLKAYCNLVFKNTGYRFNILSNRYNVCGPMNEIPESCRQLIAVCDFQDGYWDHSMSHYIID